MMKLLISGACGRMGRLIAQEARGFGFVVTGGIDPSAGDCGDFPIFASFADVRAEAQILVDFSSPLSLPDLLAFAGERNLPCVLGTTGYTLGDIDHIRKAALGIPVFQSPNMSRGVYVLRQLAAQAARMLPSFDIEIVEKHHNQKADSPSGTALSLMDAVKNDQSLPVFGREGKDAKRRPPDIGIHSVRGGTVAGDHEIGFYGSHEVITLSHQAQSRVIFAAGALSAAAWLIGKEPGLYGMEDLMA